MGTGSPSTVTAFVRDTFPLEGGRLGVWVSPRGDQRPPKEGECVYGDRLTLIRHGLRP